MKNKIIRNRPKPKDDATMRNIKVSKECYELFMQFGQVSEGMHTIARWILTRKHLPSLNPEDATRIVRLTQHHIENNNTMSLKEFKGILGVVQIWNKQKFFLGQKVDDWTDKQYEALQIALKMAICIPSVDKLMFLCPNSM